VLTLGLLHYALREREKELNESYRQNAEQAKSLFDIMQQKTAALKEIEQKTDRYNTPVKLQTCC
jgi:hypothetical protein